MSNEKELQLMQQLKEQALAGGLIVRFESYGVLVMCTSQHGPPKAAEQAPELPVDMPPAVAA